ncbi:MAG: B12-binding domain-containing radical SAM protein [Thermodesulfobacteriota bacterium]
MIALVNPPSPPGRVSNKDMMGGFGQCYPPECEVVIPPTDLPYIVAVLEESKVEARVIECLGSGLTVEKLIAELKKDRPKMVFIRTSTPTFSWDAEVSGRIKEALKTKVVFFGPHVGVVPDDVLANPHVDAIILGEAEYTIRDIALQGFSRTAGLWYKGRKKIIKNKSRAPIEDLDGLPFPAWGLLPYKAYTAGDIMPPQSPTLFLQTSRGCPFSCSYCPYPVAQGTRYRKRSAKNVLDEIAFLKREFDVKNLIIRDAEFTLDRERVVEICEGLIRAGHGISWRCETRVDTLDEELIGLMSKAGCMGINMGIESASAKVCEKVGRKPLDAVHTKAMVRICRELGVHTFCFFIIGLPGDDIESVMETIEYAVTLDADVSQFTVATPYLGTGLYDWAMEHNAIKGLDLEGITGFEAMMDNEALSSERMMELRNGAQGLLDLIQERRGNGAEKRLKQDSSLLATLTSLLYLPYFLAGRRRVVVYGTHGLNIALLRRLGFEVLAVVDEFDAGRLLDGRPVLDADFIRVLEPEALLRSPYKIKRSLQEMLGMGGA